MCSCLSLTTGPQPVVQLRGDEVQSLDQLEVALSYPIHDQNLSHALPRILAGIHVCSLLPQMSQADI